jgi:DNA-binding XRE family transcriptional regulator
MPKQNTKPADYPQAVIKQIELLAQNIVIARKRRKETQAQWARKLGVSQPTMARIERGDPSVAMASYVMCMWLINQASGLADLISPQKDHTSLEREITKARSRGLSVATASPQKPGASPAEQLAAHFKASPAEKLAAHFRASPAEQLAAHIRASPAEQLAAHFKASPAEKLAAQFGANTDGTSNAKIAAGLAALLSKAEPKSK